MLPFGGFYIDFDLAGLKMHRGAGILQQNFHSCDTFCIPNWCKLQRKSAHFHSSDAFCIPNCFKFQRKSADFHSSDAFLIPNCSKVWRKSAD
jgi:hypothetical protein